MSKDFKLIMENWREFSSNQNSTVLQEQGGADEYKQMYKEHYEKVQGLLDKYSPLMTTQQVADISEKNRKYRAIARDIDLSLNDSLNTFWSDLEAMMSGPLEPEAPEELPIAAESKKLNEQDDDKTDPEVPAVGGDEDKPERIPKISDARKRHKGMEADKAKLEELKSILPKLAGKNQNLIDIVSRLEATLKTGNEKLIREEAGRIANVIHSLALNEKKANSVYELRLRAMYLLIGATGVEVVQFVADQKAWVLKFVTNVYTQYSAAYRAWVGALDKYATQWYDKIWADGGKEIVDMVVKYAGQQGAEAPGFFTRTKWRIINKALEGNKEALLAKAKEGVQPLKDYIDSVPLIRRFVEDLAVAKNIGKLDVAPQTTYDHFTRGFESIWAYIINAGPTAQIFFWTTITMLITGMIYNWYTKDPQNPISMAWMALTQALKKDLGRLAGLAGSVAGKIKGWVFKEKPDKIEESLSKLKIILDKKVLGVL